MDIIPFEVGPHCFYHQNKNIGVIKMIKNIFLFGMVLALSVTSIAAEFNSDTARKFVKEKNYVALQNYLKTNNECKSAKDKQWYASFQYKVRVIHLKEFKMDTLLSSVKNDVKNNNISDRIAIDILYSSRYAGGEFATNKNFARLTIKYFESEPNIALHPPVIYSYQSLGNHNTVISLLSKRKAPGRVGAWVVAGAKSFTDENKLALLELIKNRPTEFVFGPNDLKSVIALSKRFSDVKHDTLLKDLYLKLNRLFYSKISVSDEWKAAIIELNLQMKAYGLN